MFWTLVFGFAAWLAISLSVDMVYDLTPLSDHMKRWTTQNRVTCFEWLYSNPQPLDDNLEGFRQAIQNYTRPGTQNSSPQLIIFPQRPKHAQKLQFLSLPAEIRVKIYELFFATRVYNPFEVDNLLRGAYTAACPFVVLRSLSWYWPIARIQYSERATANSKIPILLTNKTIYAEARAIFYRNHTFRFADSKGKGGLLRCRPRHTFYQSLAWMTEMELTNSKHYFPYRRRPVSLHRQLYVLDDFCPNLNSLRVDYHLNRPEVHLPSIRGLWARLKHIEIRVTCFQWSLDQLMLRHFESIAPAEDWSKVGVRNLDGYYNRHSDGTKELLMGIPQHTFMLDRPGP